MCRNLLGAYVCLDIGRGGQQQGCPSGFRPTSSSAGSPLNCTDVDECAEGTYDCDRREQCENFIGSYTCEEKVRLRTDSGSSSTTRSSMVETENSNSNLTNCAKGYHFVRFSYTCEDTNECRIGQHDCDLSRERCINFPGTYRCVPLVLGEGKGSGGGDSGDAGTGAEENDKQSSARLSSLRFTQKLCPSGYERNEELNICEDSDECNGGLLPPCSENAYCQNTIGSYVCHCKVMHLGKWECFHLNFLTVLLFLTLICFCILLTHNGCRLASSNPPMILTSVKTSTSAPADCTTALER